MAPMISQMTRTSVPMRIATSDCRAVAMISHRTRRAAASPAGFAERGGAGPGRRSALLRPESGGAQQMAQVDDGLDVQVLLARRVEELGLRPHRDGDLAVVLLGPRADVIEQRPHGPPLDVVARGVLEDLAECVPVVVVEVL